LSYRPPPTSARSFPARSERFEDNPGVISETRTNPEVDLHKLAQAASAKTIDHVIEFFAAPFAVENLEGWFWRADPVSPRSSRESRVRSLSMICNISGIFPRAHSGHGEKIDPEFASLMRTTTSFAVKPKPRKQINAERDQLDSASSDASQMMSALN